MCFQIFQIVIMGCGNYIFYYQGARHAGSSKRLMHQNERQATFIF